MRFSEALKHKTVLAALIAGLGYHGACSAAIGFGSVSGGELFLDVVNITATASATFDLGFPTFASRPGLAVDPMIQTFDIVALSAPGVRLTWDLSGTSAWSSFVRAAGTSLGKSKFDIKAIGPSDPYNNEKVIFLTTASSGDPINYDLTTEQLKLQSFASLQGFAVVGDFVTATNAEATHNDELNGANFVKSTSANDSPYHEMAVGDDWHHQFSGDVRSTGPIGAPLPFYELYGTLENTFTDATEVRSYGGVWTLSEAGLLSYATAPVPEPTTGAMLVAGLVAFGAIARRRLRRPDV